MGDVEKMAGQCSGAHEDKVVPRVYKWLRDNDYLEAAIALKTKYGQDITVTSGRSLAEEIDLIDRITSLTSKPVEAPQNEKPKTARKRAASKSKVDPVAP